MDLIDRLRDLATRVTKQLEYIQTEEATKNALVMPFLASLGYDVFNPLEVTPELNADIGLKKGEKVDYAILRDGKPVMLLECKHHNADLGKAHASQLYRYFSVTEARFGILTNGLSYWFYTDLEAPNKMDTKPFFEFNLLDIREQDVDELKKFTKATFDVAGIVTTASELKYTREIKRIMGEQLTNPSEEFIKFFATQVYSGRMTANMREQFGQTTRRALRNFINDQVNDRLKTALGTDTRITIEETPAAQAATDEPVTAADKEATGVLTTMEELEAFYIVRSILREAIDAKRIVMRDKQSYCGILLDDNNRKPICRLWLNSTTTKSISLFDNQRKEEKVQIKDIDDIYKFADRLRATIAAYTNPKAEA
ncbi:type I restriction endonuclease [Herpetosiphon giganteus]|uniref:type I restriction endonuclease n=1 Tax=Herpetosiphon giganteus TaxID=2029754 RepID=UPI001956280E|nr:type I restriction endonuclease [Herpetosiphon giganteus]MBM7845374.1 hypothetical protein [Herpetosiphon giganteus]